jgi:hypothetical protein
MTDHLRDATKKVAEPVAWGMPRPDGTILDVICPDEHEIHEGEYTVPLYAHPQPKAEPCQWHQEDDDTGAWASGCGELWSFIDGGPNENRVRFCHGCGKPVEVQP